MINEIMNVSCFLHKKEYERVDGMDGMKRLRRKELLTKIDRHFAWVRKKVLFFY